MLRDRLQATVEIARRPSPRAALLTLAFYGLAMVILGAAAGSKSGVAVVVAVLLVVVLAYLIHKRLSEWRQQASLRSLAITSVALIAVGLLAVVWWSRGHADGWAFFGVTAAFFGAGQLLAALRSSSLGGPRRGYRLAAACALVFLAGLLVFTLESVSWALRPMALAVLVSPIGLGLVSEDVLDRRTTSPCLRWRLLAAGGLMAVGVLSFIALGAPAIYAFLFAVPVLIMVGAIASKTDTDIVILLIGFTLLFALTPRDSKLPDVVVVPPENESPVQKTQPPRKEAVFPPGQEVIVALGDSFMSGEGAKRYFEGTNTKGRNECRRAGSAYAAEVVAPEHQKGDKEPIPDRVVFVACSGAKATHIHDEPQYEGEPVDGPAEFQGKKAKGLDQLAQFEWLDEDRHFAVKLVVVSIGGNDALFGEIGETCVGPGDCSQVGTAWLEQLGDTRPKLEKAYKAIRKAFEGVPVLVVPYPIPLNVRGCDSSWLSRDEHRFLYGFTQELNKVVRHEAAVARFHYLHDMETVLEKRRIQICDKSPGKVGVNFLAANPVAGVLTQRISPTNWFHNSLHPNHRGHDAMRETLAAWMVANPHPPSMAPTTAPTESPPIGTIEGIMGDRFAHCSDPDAELASCRASRKHWVAAQASRVIWYSLVPLLLLIAGAWLISLEAILWWRRRRSTGVLSAPLS